MGLDVGSHNIRATVLVNGAAVAVPDAQGQVLHPAVLAMGPDGPVVGPAARVLAAANPADAAVRLRQVLGRAFYSGTAKALQTQLPYALVEGAEHAILVRLRGELHTPVALTARLCAHVRALAEAHAGRTLDRVCATVEAGADAAQRQALTQSLMDAGFVEVRLVDEPLAVVRAHQLGADGGNILMFQMSAHALHITVLRNKDGVPRELSRAMDPHLGGDDLDERIVQWALGRAVAEHGADPTVDPATLAQLRLSAEAAKNALSDVDATPVRLPSAMRRWDGGVVDAQLMLERSTFNQLCADVLQRVFKILDEAIQQAGLTSGQVDHVVLVGGPARVPLLVRALARYFKKPARGDVDPRTVVAVGALLQVADQEAAVAPPPTAALQGALGREVDALLAVALALESRCAQQQGDHAGASREAVLELETGLEMLGLLKGSLVELWGLCSQTRSEGGLARLTQVVQAFTDHRVALETMVYRQPPAGGPKQPSNLARA